MPPAGSSRGSKMPSTNTSYYPGGIQTDTQGGYGNQVGAQLQALMPDYNALFGAQQQAANRKQGFAEEMGRGQLGLQQQEMAMRQQQMAQQQAQQRALGTQQIQDRNRALSVASQPQTPEAYGRFQMNNQGGWGTFVDPARIPAHLQGTIMGGFYGSGQNWDTSNPSITGPQQFATGKYTHSGGGGGPVSGAPSLTTGGYRPGQQAAVENSGPTVAERYFQQFGRAPSWAGGGQQ